MGIREDRFTTFAQFAGFNNLTDEYALASSTLREALNLDYTREGKLKSRIGYGPVLVPCADGHSFWADDLLPFGLYADEDELIAFNADHSTQVIRGGLSDGLPISYARINEAVCWSNGIERGMVTMDLESLDWACPNPDGQPELAPLPNGNLGGGIVQVAVTFVDALGRESGSTLAASITVEKNRGVQITGIPQPADPNVARVRVYATAGNDGVLYLAETLPVGITSYAMLDKPKGKALATQFLTPMPAGHIVRYWNGRQLVARNRGLMWSPALRYGLTHIGHAHVGFAARVDLVEPVGDGTGSAGVYVAAGPRTYYLAGSDPNAFSQRTAYGYGAVEGSSCRVPAELLGFGNVGDAMLPAWLARSGLFLVGLPGGQVVPYKEGEAVAMIGESAASLFRQSRGINQIVTAVRGGFMPRAAVAEKLTVRVYDENGKLKA